MMCEHAKLYRLLAIIGLLRVRGGLRSIDLVCGLCSNTFVSVLCTRGNEKIVPAREVELAGDGPKIHTLLKRGSTE